MKRLASILPCFTLMCLLAAANGGEKKGTVEGSWTATAAIVKGKKLPKDVIDNIMLVVTFKDGKYSVKIGGKDEEAGTYKIDAKKTPATIDMLIAEGKEKGKTQLGIYKVDEDKLV